MWFTLDAAAVQMAIAFVAAAQIRCSAACIVATHGIAGGCAAMGRDLHVTLVALATSGCIAEAMLAAMPAAGHTDVMLSILGHKALVAQAEIGRYTGAIDATRLADRFTATGSVVAPVGVSHIAYAFLRLQAESIATALAAAGITQIGLIASCLVPGMTAAFVGRHTVPMHARLLAPRHTTAECLVALIPCMAQAFLRFSAATIRAIDLRALRLTHTLAIVAQPITLAALADLGLSAASIDAGLTALGQADAAIYMVVVALVAQADIGCNALAPRTAFLALRQTLGAEGEEGRRGGSKF